MSAFPILLLVHSFYKCQQQTDLKGNITQSGYDKHYMPVIHITNNTNLQAQLGVPHLEIQVELN